MECPLISGAQKIVVYETSSRMYVVGSNKRETKFRVIEIDRLRPYHLHVIDNQIVYNQREIKAYLQEIDSANRVGKKAGTSGLTQVVSAHGIVGFVKFLTGYYIILIKKRRMVATIGPHTVYKIEDTCMISIPNDIIKVGHPDESRYERMFQNIDLTSNFYFSYSYDLTHSLQYNMTPCQDRGNQQNDGSTNDPPQNNNTCTGVRNSPCKKFAWNQFLLEEFEGFVHFDWLLYLTHGFIGQSSISIFGKPIYLTLIARRSNKFAGTRFLKRGANCEGSVANEIETEQIVSDASITVLNYANITSFVQQRGSVPLFWSQDVSTMVPKPPITLDQTHPYSSIAGKHFSDSLNRYGAPVIILNLVKTRENKRHESLLSVNLKDQCIYLNQFLPSDYTIRHIGFDMARVNKKKNSNVLYKLDQIAQQCLKETGLNFHSRKRVHAEFWDDKFLCDIGGVKTTNGSRQTGIVRTNCVDCLDRTNTAQFAVGKCFLGYQLYILGVISKPSLQFETDCVRMLEDLYEDHGHTVALQYGGSQLVHRVKTYRKIAPWTSHSRDIMQTLSRYYNNAFSDAEKQQAINLFLGIFRPTESITNVWELSTDYYLHNADAAGAQTIARKSYTQWFDAAILDSLPLPHDEETKDKNNQLCSQRMEAFEESVNAFEEYHHIHEVSFIHECYAYNVPSTTRDFMPKLATNFSPFCLRVKPAHLHVEPNIDASLNADDSLNSTTPADSGTSSDSDTSSIHGISELIESSASSEFGDERNVADKSRLRDLPSSKNVYGYEITNTPLGSRHAENLYKRYVELDQLANRDLDTTEKFIDYNIEMSPISVFKLDSSYCVELPALSRHTSDLYKSSVKTGSSGYCCIPSVNLKVYDTYYNFKFM